MHEEFNLNRSKKAPSLNVAIIGLTQSPELLHDLDGSSAEVVAVADFDLRHDALREAQRRGLFVSQDYTAIMERPNLDLIVNLIPDKTVEAIIQQLKPDRTQVIHAATASFLRAFCQESAIRRDLAETIGDVTRWLSGFLDPLGLTTRVLQRALDLAPAVAVGVWVRQGESFVLFRGLHLPAPSQGYRPAIGLPGPFVRLAEERAPLWIRDVRPPYLEGDHEPFEKSGFTSFLLLPMFRELELQGVMGLFQDRVVPFPKEILLLFQTLAELLAQVVQREGAIYGGRDAIIRDEMTGLYNQVHFLDRLKVEMKRAMRRESPLSLLYVTVRPEQAEEHEDQGMTRPFIRALAADLMASIRNVDLPARYKSDDFVVILPDTSPTEALSIAGRLMERLAAVRPNGIDAHPVRLSIGTASFPDHALQPKELLDNAELAAFLAGREGQNQIRTFPTGRMELNGLTPEAIIRKHPVLAEVFQVLSAQGNRDRSTFEHAQEVARYASLLAREMGLPPHEVTEVGIAGWLHDLGKLTLPGLNGGLPDRLSNLPALSSKIHPTIGAYILKNLIRSPAILKAVLYHHTRYDGSGQAPRLHGDGIPVEARILAVADAYHHLTVHAAGSPAAPQRDLFQSLRRQAGQELDPQMVESLIRGVTAG
jgi:diguanylate cyclase (GGDEF)-like protein/putative nucleotidyltransferase with HDIG domain